jgi:hypothetical protein
VLSRRSSIASTGLHKKPPTSRTVFHTPPLDPDGLRVTIPRQHPKLNVVRKTTTAVPPREHPLAHMHDHHMHVHMYAPMLAIQITVMAATNNTILTPREPLAIRF